MVKKKADLQLANTSNPSIPGKELKRIPPLPKEAKDMGIAKSGQYARPPTSFTLDSGPQSIPSDTSAPAIWMMFLEEGFLSHTLNHAKVLKKDKGVEISCTKESLQRFCCYQLGSGISRIAREGLLFQRNGVDGLLHNEFLSTIITHDELVKYKKIYVGDRSKMTEIFNKTSTKYWKPYQ